MLRRDARRGDEAVVVAVGHDHRADEPRAHAPACRVYVLLLLVAVWSLLAMACAPIVFGYSNGWVSALYYVVAGFGWVLPAMPLISWMTGPRRP